MEAKLRAAASIAQARAELDHALAEIDSIRTYDPSVLGLVAHALSTYVTVTGATAEMLQRRLHDTRDPDITNWLEGIRHAANLMQHSVGHLVSLAAPRDFPLKRDYVNLSVLMERACEFHRSRAESAGVSIVCHTVGHVPLAWGDRVALAVIADNLLSYAVQSAPRDGTVRVGIFQSNDEISCTVRGATAGLTAGELAQLFDRPAPGASGGEQESARPGLVIAREFARRMDGDLWTDSDPGHGAYFTFRVPALKPPA